jgi:hypothetical protein
LSYIEKLGYSLYNSSDDTSDNANSNSNSNSNSNNNINNVNNLSKVVNIKNDKNELKLNLSLKNNSPNNIKNGGIYNDNDSSYFNEEEFEDNKIDNEYEDVNDNIISENFDNVNMNHFINNDRNVYNLDKHDFQENLESDENRNSRKSSKIIQ